MSIISYFDFANMRPIEMKNLEVVDFELHKKLAVKL